MVNARPRFSVIVPTFHREHVIGRMLQSVQQQPEAQNGGVEVVIIDDSRDDATIAEAVRQASLDPVIPLVVHRDGRLGVTGARNRGFDLANGEIIVLLDSDDEFMPGALGAIDAFFYAHPEIDLFFGSVIRSSGAAARRAEQWLDREVSYDDMLLDRDPGEFLPAVRAHVLKQSSLRFAAEAEGSEGILWRRIPRAGFRVWYSSTVVRRYDDGGADRNSTIERRLSRARVFARGHRIWLDEFGADLKRLSRKQYWSQAAKTALYNRLAAPPDADDDAAIRRQHPMLHLAARVIPAGALRSLFARWTQWRHWRRI